MRVISLEKTKVQDVIEQTIAVLKNGGLIIFPTETTYGAGVDATNPQAVEKLLAYKSRREGKPLSIAVADQEMASKYVEINEQAKKLYQKFLPGPVTVVSLSKNQVAPGVESEFGTLGVRIPDYQLILDIVKNFGKPMTATSANASNKKRPYKITDILDNLSEKQKSLIDLIIDAGQLPHRDPSLVIDTTNSTPIILRTVQNLNSNLENLNKTQILKLKSQNEDETKDIAGKLLLKHWNQLKSNGLIIGLNGPLGSGKTIFAKGAAKFLKIEDEITSPTYTYINEYDFERHGVKGKFFHLDLWKIDSQEEFDRLETNKLKPITNNFPILIIIEWWDQVKKFAEQNSIKPNLIIDFEETGKLRLLIIEET